MSRMNPTKTAFVAPGAAAAISGALGLTAFGLDAGVANAAPPSLVMSGTLWQQGHPCTEPDGTLVGPPPEPSLPIYWCPDAGNDDADVGAGGSEGVGGEAAD
jgi:hypothetical protein